MENRFLMGHDITQDYTVNPHRREGAAVPDDPVPRAEAKNTNQLLFNQGAELLFP